MTKKFLLAIIIALICSLFCSCISLPAPEKSEESNLEQISENVEANDNYGDFIILSKKIISYNNDTSSVFTQYIMYDSVDYVMYSLISGNRKAGLTMMYNPDGTPKLYTPPEG